MSIGYSSHGVFCSIAEILEAEQERENEYTVECITNFLNQNTTKKNSKAIWVAEDPFFCFKMYCLPAMYFNYEDNILKMKFPDWYHNIYAIDLSNMQLVCCDEQGGYLYCA